MPWYSYRTKPAATSSTRVRPAPTFFDRTKPMPAHALGRVKPSPLTGS